MRIQNRQPNLEPIKPDGMYRLTEPAVYAWEYEGETYRIIVPANRITDIATVPRLVWTFSGVLPDGLHRLAAVMHDELYRWQGALPTGQYQVHHAGSWVNVDPPHTFSRQECDRLFMRVMKEMGVAKWKRFAMYWAVRACGRFYWNKSKK